MKNPAIDQALNVQRQQFVNNMADFSQKLVAKKGEAVGYVYTHKRTGNLCAVVWLGRAMKPEGPYRFKTVEARAKWVRDQFERAQAIAVYKEKQAAEKAAKAQKLVLGAVLRASWGYDQTNIDYYQVTKVIGRMVEIRELAQERVECEGYMQGKCVPLLGQYTSEPMRKLAQGDRVKLGHHSAYLVEPKMVAGVPVYEPSHWTAYA